MLRNVLATATAALALTLAGCVGGNTFTAQAEEVESDGQVVRVTALRTDTNIEVTFICGITEGMCGDLKKGDTFTAVSGPRGRVTDVRVVKP